ncbi:CBS domain-containing protein [Pseudoalteromonas lipolytica]|jgi:CBS-domain-containing membrane protein|uniref:CBS domain-containing protein n=2 Tax=Pseudoalteromonas TaxID=53246 RepID=A0ABY1GI64_9GAMM|nr:CBS domain-containing protein [Pseudoalteromonas lipolytica]
MVIKMNNFKELRLQDISNGALSNAVNEVEPTLDLTSPALKVLNSFTSKDPLRAHYDTTIVNALKQTSNHCSDFILVIDSEDKLLGITSSADLQSSKIMMLAQRLNLHRDEITLHDVMTPLSNLAGASLQSISYACIGDVLQTMEHQGMMFLLVTSKEHEICGLISARQIAKKLHIPVNINPIANSFSEVMQHIDHPH